MLVSVDIETDGPAPGLFSMIAIGAVIIDKDRKLDRTFHGLLKPISNLYQEAALKVSNLKREDTLTFNDPKSIMEEFNEWVISNSKGKKPIFLSDNPAFDFAFINFYFHLYIGNNPFGWSGRRLGDMFCGFYKNAYYKWKEHRITKHTHNPVDDAKGNAEALLYLIDQGYKLKL